MYYSQSPISVFLRNDFDRCIISPLSVQTLLQGKDYKPQDNDYLDLAQSVFNHFLRKNKTAAEIVDDFKSFLFKKFSVPEDIQGNVKTWTAFLLDSSVSIKEPKLVIHPSREHFAIDPPKGTALYKYCNVVSKPPSTISKLSFHNTHFF
jgi:hypothetical protein